MKNNNVSSNPNDTVAIICSVVKGVDDSYSIDTLEVAYGKLDEKGTDFICIDNKQSYECLSDNLYDLEEGKQYYCFDKTVEELRNIYGEEHNINKLMISYLRSVFETYNFINKDGDNKYNIHSVPKVIIDKKSDDPIKEIENSTQLKVPEIITKKYGEGKMVDSSTRVKVDPLHDTIDLEDFENYLKRGIIGNDETIDNIATTIAMNLCAEDPKDVENILSIGPTGSGKSQTFKDIADYLTIPVVMCDSTQLSAPGYVGKDVEDYLKDIYLRAEGNIELANRAIFILDEIDKLKSCGLEMKEAAQDTLLKVIEGQEYTVELDKTRGTSVQMNTLGMTIVGSGAFSKIFDDRMMNAKKNSIGFASGKEEKVDYNDPKFLAEVTDEELKKFGFKAEFIPRFPNRNVYKKLDKDGMRIALTEGRNSALRAKIRRYLKQFNTEVIYDDAFIDAIIDEAIKADLGARALNNITARCFKRADNYLLKNEKSKAKVLTLTADTVKDNKKFDIR